jgi:hypothetical protein
MNRRAAACLAAVALALTGCSADTSSPSTQRSVLLAPDLIAAAARAATDDPQAKWLLGQPRAVRASYVHDVIDPKGDTNLLSQKWLLTQSDAVRRSYVSDVLLPKLGP